MNRVREKRDMANESKFKPTVKLANAVALILGVDPTKWGAAEHLAAMSYLILISDPKHEKLTMEQIAKLPADTVVTVKWETIKAELRQDSKLAECANFYKWLQQNGDMDKVTKASTKYA